MSNRVVWWAHRQLHAGSHRLQMHVVLQLSGSSPARYVLSVFQQLHVNQVDIYLLLMIELTLRGVFNFNEYNFQEYQIIAKPGHCHCVYKCIYAD